MLQFGLRLGRHPRCLVATTPRPTKLIRELLAREGRGVTVTRGSTYENRANLAPGFFDQTALHRQPADADALRHRCAECRSADASTMRAPLDVLARPVAVERNRRQLLALRGAQYHPRPQARA